ncbi:hypothetical protein ACW4TU_19605 [Streptomyces sp. QTS52]
MDDRLVRCRRVALVGGGPLVAVGKVHGLGEALVAGGAPAVALAGVCLAVWQVSRVLVPPITTTATLGTSAACGLRERVDASPGTSSAPPPPASTTCCVTVPSP